jgi:putative FmdB family regulatory protein
MPTYDYLCESCGPFEAMQSMKDAPLTVCPQCGGKASRQFSTNVNFVFKGSGFYITDYRKDDYKKRAAEDAKSGSAPVPTPPAAPGAAAPGPSAPAAPGIPAGGSTASTAPATPVAPAPKPAASKEP